MRTHVQNDFGTGKIWKTIMLQALPLTLAQLVQLLYSVVDRIYIGHLSDVGNLALTGIGLTFPITTIIAACTNLFGSGGIPLFSMARGAKREKKAEQIMGNAFTLLVFCGLLLTLFCYLFRRPILFAFGAGEASYTYADQYLQIYLMGTVCSMVTTGMNGFINAQGFPRTGMFTTLIGAILNLILDPILIFGLQMGVRGAALATVISQLVSALWVLRFLTGKASAIRLTKGSMRLRSAHVKGITGYGMAGFIVQFTNAAVQIVCNATLQGCGGDLYVGIMTIINSIREIANLPIHGITSGAQPVLSYNYGAGDHGRVKSGIRVSALMGIVYTVLFWLLVLLLPGPMIGLFTSDGTVLTYGIPALHIYFFGFCFMALQFIGQSTFQALGHVRKSIFFSLLRKAIIVVPLTVLLPRLGFGVNGVFLAEPISNVVGGSLSFLTMYVTVYRKLGRGGKVKNQ